MRSPFPGMDPFIEGQHWQDFHHEFISAVRAALAPQLLPRYVVLIEEHVYLEHEPEPLRRSVRPDLSVAEEREAPAPFSSRVAVISPPVVVPLAMPQEVRQAYLEIRSRPNNQLVTVIEVLSPANKRPGSTTRAEYLAKRDAILTSSVHLVEIDLLRGGQRVPMARELPAADYYAITSRADRRPNADVWPMALHETLPTVAIPLAEANEKAPLDLQAVFDDTYARAVYAHTLDYHRAVEPLLTPGHVEWVRSILATR